MRREIGFDSSGGRRYTAIGFDWSIRREALASFGTGSIGPAIGFDRQRIWSHLDYIYGPDSEIRRMGNPISPAISQAIPAGSPSHPKACFPTSFSPRHQNRG
jgi:hypothetical protein